ncbi:hypothetical protein CC2G_009195 [Coprinopsis cinerea AmutBmut pab1-1]|nr:hypothetical protein CC2G_009195 [Coprinopsis cinerea AmutBmut pab1-1]
MSAVYEHFKSPPKLIVGRGEVTYVFVCKRNPSVEIQRRRYDDSTSNLVKHVKLCDPSKSVESEAIKVFAYGSSYHPAKHWVKLGIWVARRNRPFAIVEDPELREIFEDLNSAVQHVSRHTVPRDIIEIHNHTKDHIIKFFEHNVEGSIHIGVDGWTSPNIFAFLGVTVHYISEGLLKMLTLDFVKLIQGSTLRDDWPCAFASLVLILSCWGSLATTGRITIRWWKSCPKAILSPFAGRLTKSQMVEKSTPDLDAALGALEDDDGDGMVGNEDVESEDEEDDGEDGDELAPECGG